ncbi:hypothetical protein [Thomasclavelia cocleata]|uniref:hypothetical protein n=1 Tax=Thomasclavelia cocleata TaxID=69824 RepID=UPI00242F15A3|nr:hypothetical protein [Thomasclavelia cocleata]
MKINKKTYYNMVDEIYDLIIDKSADFVIYVSPCMYAYMTLNNSYREVKKNYVPTILGHPVKIKTELKGKEYEVIRK